MTVKKNNGYQHLEALLAAFNKGTDAVLNLYNEDATVTYPYAASLGKPFFFNMADYKKHLDNMLASMPGISWTGLKVFELKEEGSYWAEVHGETTIPNTKALYQQDYVIYFTLKNGKFSEYKEFWNVLPVLKTLLGSEEAQRIINNKNYN